MEENKYLVKFFNAKPYVHFAVYFALVTVISFIMAYFAFSHSLLKCLVFSAMLGVLFGIALTSMNKIANTAEKFYAKSDEIENAIRNNEPQEKVLEMLRELSKESFHRTTGSRVRELAKMAEIKYNIKVLK